MKLTNCDTCGNKKQTHYEYVVRTGKLSGTVKKHVGFKTDQYTNYYNDVKIHKYNVCQNCFLKWLLIPPIALSLFASILLILLTGERIFGLWFIVFAMMTIFTFLIRDYIPNIKKRLKRKALKSRRESLLNKDDRFGYEAFEVTNINQNR